MSEAGAFQSSEYTRRFATPLPPVFRSLGLPASAFRDPALAMPEPLFDSCVNLSVADPEILLIFSGATYYRYNLRTKRFEGEPRSIRDSFAAPNQEAGYDFVLRITAATDGGSEYPSIHYFFSGHSYIARQSPGTGSEAGAEQGWPVVEGPRGILEFWTSLAPWMPDGAFSSDIPLVALRGEMQDGTTVVHFFQGGEYIRHDFHGAPAVGPRAIGDVWNLPPEFCRRIDAAFHASGDNAGRIYFLSSASFVLYDLGQGRTVRSGFIADEFPAFRRFLKQPQLFIVELYDLEVLEGAIVDGALLGSKAIGPGETRQIVVSLKPVALTLPTPSLLESQDEESLEDFHSRLKGLMAPVASEAVAPYVVNLGYRAMWGGEVYALSGVQDGNQLRSDLANQIFEAIGKQNASRDTHLHYFVSDDTTPSNDPGMQISRDVFEQSNPGSNSIRLSIYELRQHLVALLSLKRVGFAFSDGSGRMREVEPAELRPLLRNSLSSEAQADQLLQYVRQDLSSIRDARGRERAFIAPAGPLADLEMAGNLSTTLPLLHPDGSSQTLTVPGVLVSARYVVAPAWKFRTEVRGGG